MKIYDERASRELVTKAEDGGDFADIFYLRVRLFKEEFSEIEGTRRSTWPVYLLVQEYESWVGEPGPERHQPDRSQQRCYVLGPDSKRIRHAIALIDAFKKG